MKMEKEEQNVEPRYMTSTKKHYYLAAVNENVQQLIKEEIDGLTRVLIELKSQYDIIRRESIDKKNQTDELCKKIDSLQKMDKKSKKKIEETNQQSEDLSSSIQAKKTRLNECIYEMKTLQSTINKLKQDNFLIQKRIMANENITKRLNNHSQKEHFKETQLKEKKNKVYSEITNQKRKNEFEKDEQNLQLQYYRTIIEQKKMFIRSDDERKERQKKIAEEAKNNSADKQEVEKRKILCLLKLYNIYLESEMEKALRKNEQLENTYREIREICGTPSLKIMVDKILTKETSYNDSLAQINELQNQIDIYDKDIAELEIKLKKLKNVVIFQEKNEKTISTLPSNIIQEEENNLIKEEEKLIEEEKLLKEKLAQINLTYKKIMENIEFFISEQKASENTSHVDEKIIKKNYNYDDTNENFYQQATAAGQSTNYDPQSTGKGNFNITKSSLLVTKPVVMNATTGEENFKKVKDTFLFRTQTPKVKMCNNIKIPIENVSVKDDSMKAPTEKDVNIDQNKIIPGFFSENDSLFDDLSNSNEIVKNYNDYLNWLNKKFDKFFLCYNKEQFKAVMAEKGIKVQESREAPRAKQPINNDRLLERRNTKKRRTRRFEGPGNNNNKINVDAGKKENYKTEDNELEFDEDDLPPKPKMEENEFSRLRKKDNKPSNDIFLRFLEEQENKTHEYIHERELRIKKK
jgi:hypothetical protein